VPLLASPSPAPKPSRLTALVCAAVVAAHDRRWLAQPVAALRAAEDPAPETLSRLKARALGSLEELVARLHRRGRPRAPSETSSLRAQLAAMRAKLDLAASVIAEDGVRSRALQDRLVAAHARLESEHATSLRDFCTSLGIPERTFRSWRNRAPAAPPAPPAPVPPPAPKPPRNEGRFALELCPPDLQAMADTTYIRAFGIDLQIVGAQDPGRRHKELLSAFAVTEQENADVVTGVLTQALGALPGAQAITDQGTPYIARATQQACEAIDIEPAPQTEASPTDKAPLERAWGTVKQALAPLLALTDRAAASVPALRSPALARAALSLLLAVFLRVYAGGRRHLAHPLEGHDPAALADVVARAREAARAENHSRKIFLQKLHADYNLAQDISVDDFVRAHRRHHLEDIIAAERALRDRACRCNVRRCDRYFAGILRNVAEQGRLRRARLLAQREEQRRHDLQTARFEQQDRFLAEHPELRLHQALDAMTVQWDERTGRLEHGGRGWARGALVRALRELRDRAPLVWSYDVDAAVRAWRTTTACPHGAQIAISALLEAERAKLLHTQSPFPPPPVPATVSPQARQKNTENARPPPSPGLTI
jgi:transposase InsO family protein